MVGFDLDGTLLDHEQAARIGIDHFLIEHGWSHPGNAGADWLRLESIHFGDYAAGRISITEQRRRRMAGLVEAVGADQDGHDVEGLFERYLAHYESAWTPYADVVGTLDQLQAMGMRLAVLTNGQSLQQVAKLRSMGILDRFEVVLAADDLPAFKPSVGAFARLCDALGQPAGSVVYVGDDLNADVHGARNAGLRPVWIDRFGDNAAPAGVPVISTLDELPALLG